MDRRELEQLVTAARDAKHTYQESLRLNHGILAITNHAAFYHHAFDNLQQATRWSLTKMFAVVNEGKDF